MSKLTQVYIVAAKRTPFGAFGGKLKDLTATELGAIAGQAALKDLPEGVVVDSVIFGNVLQSSSDAAYLARHVGLRCKLPINIPAINVNRLCGSGFQSVINAAQDIKLGDANIVMAGGAENMSQAPFVARNIRFGVKYGTDPKLEDVLAASLTDRYPQATPMAMTAEKLGAQYKITREQCDDWALISQQRAASAQKNGHFKEEIVSIPIRTRKGTEDFAVDEHPRPHTSKEGLAKLNSIFKKDGLVTAGNASGINDGAGAVIVASEEAVKKYNLKPLARLVSYHYEGVDPSIMGYGPVPAIRGALKKAGLTLKQMDLVEVNEAFAAQYLAVEKELGLDRNVTNTNGGAVALGHPLGASGSRITAHLCHELQRTKKRYAIGSACIGGGQGIAILLERA